MAQSAHVGGGMNMDFAYLLDCHQAAAYPRPSSNYPCFSPWQSLKQKNGTTSQPLN